jgi:hypothetical protein
MPPDMRASDIWAESRASRAVSSAGRSAWSDQGRPRSPEVISGGKGQEPRGPGTWAGHVGTRPGRVRDAGTHSRPAPRASTGECPGRSPGGGRGTCVRRDTERSRPCSPASSRRMGARYARHRAQAVSRVAFDPFCCVVRTFSGSGPVGADGSSAPADRSIRVQCPHGGPDGPETLAGTDLVR